IESSPERLHALRSRDLVLSRIKKKFGPKLDDVLAEAKRIEAKLGPEQNTEELLLSLEKEIEVLRKKASTLSLSMSAARKKAASTFEKQIVAELASLGIEHGKFEINISSEDLPIDKMALVSIAGKSLAFTKKGFDSVEFFLSTNKGEAPKPLAKVASGGEVSRIMLALKTVLSNVDSIPLMIFDEIDTGISGRIAQQVGKAMKSLAGKHQIIAITHLGQIAAFADSHYIVEKSFSEDITTSVLRKLSKQEHEEEIARLISGSKVTDRSIEAARSLVQEAEILVAA
ncbi:MAG: DNA repair protein RecN, partial [Ignavibacteriota bacterium]